MIRRSRRHYVRDFITIKYRMKFVSIMNYHGDFEIEEFL